jgi:hypothetical protein
MAGAPGDNDGHQSSASRGPRSASAAVNAACRSIGASQGVPTAAVRAASCCASFFPIGYSRTPRGSRHPALCFSQNIAAVTASRRSLIEAHGTGRVWVSKRKRVRMLREPGDTTRPIGQVRPRVKRGSEHSAPWAPHSEPAQSRAMQTSVQPAPTHMIPGSAIPNSGERPRSANRAPIAVRIWDTWVSTLATSEVQQGGSSPRGFAMTNSALRSEPLTGPTEQ